jgi:hypothetical protein
MPNRWGWRHFCHFKEYLLQPKINAISLTSKVFSPIIGQEVFVSPSPKRAHFLQKFMGKAPPKYNTHLTCKIYSIPVEDSGLHRVYGGFAQLNSETHP